MFWKSQKQGERQMLDIINSRSNDNRCGECGSEYPTWALWNLGILLCGRCATCHRKVLSVRGPRGELVSKVKSLSLEQWSEDQLECLRKIGNKRAENRWNPKQVPFPHDDDDDGPMEDYLREKYIEGRFCDDSIDANDYGGKFSRYSDNSGLLSPLRSHRSGRSSSRSLPRLSHRKPTKFEESKYRAEAKRILLYGFKQWDAIVESLTLSNGDVDRAMDILKHDAKVNPSLAELPPSLPKRPLMLAATETTATPVSQSSQSTPVTETPATSAGSDWWTGKTIPQAPVTPLSLPVQATGYFVSQAAHPQIYQYTDPVTGQVSYVDANGHQYLNPNDPQHQQLLMQQANSQFLSQQATQQNIMSLYNQPDQFSTNVAVSTTQPQPQQPQHPQYTGFASPGGQMNGQAAPQPSMQAAAQQPFGQSNQFWR